MPLLDDYVLVGCTMIPNDENTIFIADGNGEILKTFPTSANSHIYPNMTVQNSLQEDKYVYFDDVIVKDVDGNVLTSFDTKSLNHECILGSNIPRYYTPGFDYSTANNNILAIVSEIKYDENISKHELLENTIVEYDFNGNIIWKWNVSEHYEQLGLTEEEKLDFYENDLRVSGFEEGNDYCHMNSACVVGPNKWHDAGDERFNPDNIICCSRHMSRVFIIEKTTGNVVYVMDCRDFDIIHQHYAHVIPEGIEGAGNILLFHGHSKTPCFIEINPVSNEVVFKHEGNFRTNGMGSVQKMPDGKYLVGCSLKRKVTIVDDEHNEEDIQLPQVFYRINACPRSWVANYLN